MSKLTIDEAGLDLLTKSENGPVGKAMFRYLKAVEQTVEQRQRARIGSVPYRTTSGLTRTGAGLVGSVTMRATKAHNIPLNKFPAKGKRLRFVPKGGSSFVYARQVRHPGSTPPARYLLDAIKSAHLTSA